MKSVFKAATGLLAYMHGYYCIRRVMLLAERRSSLALSRSFVRITGIANKLQCEHP